mgnify:CR=1 FL=1
MNKAAIYPGTFDPITFGHIDVIKKGLKLFDKIIVAVSDVDNKDYLFDSAERIQIIKNQLQDVKDYINDDKSCKQTLLLDYFGETNNNSCGQCSSCVTSPVLHNFKVLSWMF